MRRRLAMWMAGLCAAATVMSALPVHASASAAPRTPAGAEPTNAPTPATADSLASIDDGAGYVPLVPARVEDTRDGVSVGAGETLDVSVLGVGGVPASGVDAVVLNVTVVRPSVAGWLTVFPAGGVRPLASNVNFEAAQTVANVVIAKVGAGGKVSLFNSLGDVHLVVDVQGWFAPEAGYTALVPSRVEDTRDGVSVGAGETLDVSVLGVGGVPASGVDAVVLNVTVVRPSVAGWLTVFPAGGVRPLASNVNFEAAQTVANVVIAKVGAGGKVSLFNSLGDVHVVVDVQGWFGSGSAVFEGPDSSWRFVPGDLVLAPGDSRVVRLVHTDASGEPTGSSLPAGVTFSTTGPDGQLAVTSLGGTRVRVTAGDTIDTVVVGAHIDGWEVGPALSVTIALLRPETVQLTDDQIVFPQLDLPAGVDAASGNVPGVDSEGPGPFTWAEYLARTNLPEDGLSDITDVDGIFDAEFWYPLVLEGAAPPVGSVVYGVEGNSVSGRVMEPAGAPTLARDGFSLVTIAIVGPQEAFLEMQYDIDYDDLLEVGVVETVVVTGEDAERLTPGRSSGPAITAPGTEQTPRQWAEACARQLLQSATASAGAVEMQPLLSLEVRPINDFYISVGDGQVQQMRMQAGMSATITAGFKVRVQARVEVEFTCPPTQLARFEQELPGYFKAISSVVYTAAVQLKLNFKVTGGPQLMLGVTCQATGEYSGGFTYSPVTGFVPLPNPPAPSHSCSNENGGSWYAFSPGTNDDSLAFTFEPTLSFPVSVSIGIRIGGRFAQIIGDFVEISAPGEGQDLGILDFIKAEVGPALKFVWENAANVLANKDAKSGLFASIDMKAGLEFKALYFLAAKFSVSKDNISGTLEIPLYASTIPIGAAAVPLKSTRIDAKVNGEEATSSPAIYVQRDDVLEIITATAPSAAGGGGPVVGQIDAAALYRKDGSSWSKVTTLGSVTPIASTGAEAVYGRTSMRISVTISETLCDSLRDEQEFAIVGSAPMVFMAFNPSSAVWGGTFKLQCVEGKLKWEPKSIPDLRPGQTRNLQILTSGARNDLLGFTGVPDWLEIDTTPISVEPLLGDEQSIPLTIKIKEDDTPQCLRRTATITVTSGTRGSAELTIREDEKCYLRFDPINITGPGLVTVNLQTEGFQPMNLLRTSITAQLPDWLHLDQPYATTPPDNPIYIHVPPSSGEMQTIPFVFSIDERLPTCTDQPARAYIVEFTDALRGKAVLTVRDPKVDKREDCGFKFTPPQLEGHGQSTLSLVDDSFRNEDLQDGFGLDWSINQPLPEWLNVSPLEGKILNEGSVEVTVTGGPPFDACLGRPEIHYPVFATVQLPGNRTLDARLVMHYELIPPVECDSFHARADGDPHMGSFDGVRWEAQTLGEYVYLQSQPGSPVDLRLVARHQPTKPEAVDESRAPTSVTALALEVNGDVVEFYTDESIYLNGVLLALTDGVPVAISPVLSVVRTDGVVRFDATGLTLSVGSRGIMLDTTVTTTGGIDLRGLLGIPDGDQSNDFTGADGTVYDPNDIVYLELPEFTDFNESWRLTHQSDSPFTRQLSPDRFSKPTPGFDQALFDEWGAQADALIATVATVCDNGVDVSLRKRYSIALELSLGTPLSTIEEYLCHYGVSGVATVDGQPVPGLTVTVDGDGVKQCVTTTGSDGSYLCMVAPASAEAADAAPTLPLQLDVVGTWEGRAGVATQTIAAFPALASTEGAPLVVVADLALDADSVPVLQVSGTVSRDGVALAGDRRFTLEAFDGASTRVGLFSVTAAVDAETGEYSFSRALPGTAVRARLFSDVDWPVFERFEAEFAALGLGANPVEFDMVFVLPRLTVSGTVSDGTVGFAGSVTIEVESTTVAGGLLPTQRLTVSPDPVTGAYSGEVPLPRRAANARALLVVPPLQESYPSAIVPVAPGLNALTLDVVHNPPVVDVHGTMLDEQGNPLSGSFTLITSFYDANDVRVAFSQVGIVPDENGEYSLLRYGRVGAVSVEAKVLAGAASEEFSSGRVAVTPGANSLQLDVTLAPVRLVVSGTFVDAAGDPLDPTTVSAQFFDGDGEPVGFQTVVVTPGVGGAYTTEFVASRLATTAQVLANIGVGAEQYGQLVPTLTSGVNNVTFDVAHNPPVLTVEGTLVDSSTGDPLPGPISIGVEFSQPNGSFIGFNTAYATVTPSPADGSYSFTMPGPHTSTTARITAYLGVNGETETAVVPVLVPGPNSFVFNAGFSVPVVTFTGTMLRTGGARLAPTAWVTLRSVDAADDELASTRFLVSIATDGTYSFTRNLPEGAVGAEAIVETSEFVTDWRSSGVLPVVDGAQTLPFDVLHQPVQLQVSGTMTKVPGQELTGPVQVGVSAIDASGTQLVYRQPTVMPAAGTGAYTFTYTLPVDTHHVDLIAFVGTYGFEQEQLTVNGIVPGALTNATFDVVHAPVVLSVSGTARVNGALSNGFVSVAAVATVPGQPGPLRVQVYPQAADGEYTATLTLPDGATSATVEVQSLDGANTFSSVQSDLLPNETRSITVDFDDSPATLTLSGTMQMFGQPAAFGSLNVRAMDASGATLAERQITLGLAPDGSYSVEVPLPDGTTQATVVATAGVGLYDTITETFEFTGLTPGANVRTASLDATRLQLTGTVLGNGLPLVVSEESLTFETTGDRGGQPFTFTTTVAYETFYTAGTGEFFFSLVIPGDITDATVSIVGVADPAPTFEFMGLTPGVYSDTWTVDVSGSAIRLFTVDGTMLNGGVPWAAGTMEVIITTYALDAENANTAVPWTELGVVTTTVEVDETLGTWSWTGNLPAGTNVVDVEVLPFGNSFGYRRAYVLPAGATPVTETFVHDFGTTEVSFGDRILSGASCIAPTLMVEYELYAFAVEPVDKTGPASTWAGAQPIEVITVVPNLEDNITRQSFHVPSDTTYLFIVMQPSSIYTDGPWNSGLGYGVTLTPDSYLGFGNNFEFTCA